MRIAQFRGHVEFEVAVVFNVRVTQTNQQSTALRRQSFYVKCNSQGGSRIRTDMNVCFRRIGSKAGSSVSPTSSSSSGIPMRTQFSKIRKKCPSVILIIFKAFSFSLFLIHRLACSCGSIILRKEEMSSNETQQHPTRSYSGHRRPFVTRMAFSVLKSSRGKPCVVHLRMEKASAKTWMIDGLSDTGMECSLQPLTQSETSYEERDVSFRQGTKTDRILTSCR